MSALNKTILEAKDTEMFKHLCILYPPLPFYYFHFYWTPITHMVQQAYVGWLQIFNG